MSKRNCPQYTLPLKIALMKVTAKQQVTMPQSIRKTFGLLPETEVEFMDQGETLLIRCKRPQPHRGWALVKRMRGMASPSITTDQLLRLSRKHPKSS